MKKYIALVFLMTSSIAIAQNNVSTYTWSCDLVGRTSLPGGISQGTFNCSNIENKLRNYASEEGKSAYIINVEEKLGKKSQIRGQNNTLPSKKYTVAVVQHNEDTSEDSNNQIGVDYPERLPDFLQDPRPDRTYYAPETGQIDDQIADSVTTDLTGNISESADSRIQNQLQTAQFQFRKSSCENSDKASINNCYRTSQEGAIQKTGAD